MKNENKTKKELVHEIKLLHKKIEELTINFNEIRYLTLFETANDGILLYKDGIFFDCNQKALEIFKCQRQQLSGKGPFVFSPKQQPDGSDSQKKASQKIKSAFKGIPQRFEWQYTTIDGSVLYTDISLNALEIVGNSYIQVIVRDITEQRRNQNELNKLSAAIKHSPNIIMITDTKGIIEYVNPKFIELTGFKAEDVLNKNSNILKSHENSDEFYKTLWSALTAGKEWQGTFINRKKSGEKYYEEASISPIINSENQVTHFVKVGKDVTQQKMIEQELRDSEKEKSLILENLHDIFYKSNMDGNVLFITPSVQRISGYMPEEVLGQKITHFLISTKDFERLETILYTQGYVDNYIVQVSHKQGHPIWLLFSANLESDSLGNPLTVNALVRDVTDSINAQNALKESEARQRAILNSAMFPIIIMSAVDNRVLFVNPRGEELLGMEADKLINIPFPDDFYTDPDDKKIIFKVLKSRGTIRNYELLIKPTHKKKIWALISITKMNYDGEAAYLASVNNIDEIKKMEVELQKLATTDYLTGANNRRQFLKRGNEEFYRAKRYRRTMSLLMLDIDNFKKLNDTYGHPAGDKALIEVAQACISVIRESDIFGRLGGEEFSVILIETNEENAFAMAERIREKIESISFGVEKGTISMTASIGVTTMRLADESIDKLIQRADTALYEAKKKGKNCVMESK